MQLAVRSSRFAKAVQPLRQLAHVAPEPLDRDLRPLVSLAGRIALPGESPLLPRGVESLLRCGRSGVARRLTPPVTFTRSPGGAFTRGQRKGAS
jgi:hypothetical protein